VAIAVSRPFGVISAVAPHVPVAVSGVAVLLLRRAGLLVRLPWLLGLLGLLRLRWRRGPVAVGVLLRLRWPRLFPAMLGLPRLLVLLLYLLGLLCLVRLPRLATVVWPPGFPGLGRGGRADVLFLAAYLRFRDIPPFVFYILLLVVGLVVI
jgi:hypothetical protein